MLFCIQSWIQSKAKQSRPDLSTDWKCVQIFIELLKYGLYWVVTAASLCCNYLPHTYYCNYLPIYQYLPHISFTESPTLLQPSRQECVVSKHKFTKLITSMDGESERWSPQQLSWIKYLTDLKLMPLKLTENKSLVPWHYSLSRSSAIHGFMVAMPMLSRYLPHLLVFSI